MKSRARAMDLLRTERFHILVAEDNLEDGSALDLVTLVDLDHPKTITIASSPDRFMRSLFKARRCQTVGTFEGLVAAFHRVLTEVNMHRPVDSN